MIFRQHALNLDESAGAIVIDVAAHCHVAYIEILTDVNARNNANVNDDEEINIKDLTLLARHVANIELIA